MTEASPQSFCRIIDSATALEQAIEELLHQQVLYVSAKSEALHRHGSISIFQVANETSIFLFDLVSLGDIAFAAGAKGSLRSLMENPSIRKVAYDIRNFVNALHYLHNVVPSNLLDAQCLQMALLPKASFLTSFMKSLKLNAVMCTEAWQDLDEVRTDMGRKCTAELHAMRPIAEDLIWYSLLDIFYYPELYRRLNCLATAEHRATAIEKTYSRVTSALSPSYEPYGPHHRLNV